MDDHSAMLEAMVKATGELRAERLRCTQQALSACLTLWEHDAEPSPYYDERDRLIGIRSVTGPLVVAPAASYETLDALWRAITIEHPAIADYKHLQQYRPME